MSGKEERAKVELTVMYGRPQEGEVLATVSHPLAKHVYTWTFHWDGEDRGHYTLRHDGEQVWSCRPNNYSEVKRRCLDVALGKATKLARDPRDLPPWLDLLPEMARDEREARKQ